MNEPLYKDKIIEIHSDGILLKNLFPLLWNPKIIFKDIEYIEIHKPDLRSGKYRISGTGDFKSWFNLDFNRPKRDKIFLIYRYKKWWRYGFTSLDSNKAIELLKTKVDLRNGNLLQ